MNALAKAQAKTEAQRAKTEAQRAKTEAQLAQLGETMNALAAAQIKTEATTRALGRQWQAYLNTLPKT